MSCGPRGLPRFLRAAGFFFDAWARCRCLTRQVPCEDLHRVGKRDALVRVWIHGFEPSGDFFPRALWRDARTQCSELSLVHDTVVVRVDLAEDASEAREEAFAALELKQE
jgi:hypothetical protein